MVVDGVDQTKEVIIITKQAKEIAEEIYKVLGRTVTFMDGKGLISGETTIMYVVLNRFEISDLKEIIDKPGIQAFVTISEVSEIYGNHIKKKPKIKEEEMYSN